MDPSQGQITGEGTTKKKTAKRLFFSTREQPRVLKSCGFINSLYRSSWKIDKILVLFRPDPHLEVNLTMAILTVSFRLLQLIIILFVV